MKTIPDLIAHKRDGGEWTEEEVSYIVELVADAERTEKRHSNAVGDDQLGALLMAIYLRSMSVKETVALTRSMLQSGDSLSWSPEWKVVDKHSTGGVGDKISLPLAPVLASLGLKVPMISGRGLGHTGGTLDKLESIPGFTVGLSSDALLHCLQTSGCFIAGQTGNIVPADRRMYRVRDVTATVASIPLITGSIIAKKAAEGLNALVLDVKVGRAAFMQSIEEAKELADSLVNVSRGLGIQCAAVLSRMEIPIGKMIGNALEVQEAVLCLNGKGPSDLVELVEVQAALLLIAAGECASLDEGRLRVRDVLNGGKAVSTFCEMLVAQGVQRDTASRICSMDFSALPQSKVKTPVCSARSGYIVDMNAMGVGKVAFLLGGGRQSSSDTLNYAVGVELIKQCGEFVEEGEAWAYVHHDDELTPELRALLNDSIVMSETAPATNPLERVVSIIQ